MMVLFINCNKESDTNEEPMEEQPCVATKLSDIIVGKWVLVASNKNIEFKADKTYVDNDNFFNDVDLAKGPFSFKYFVTNTLVELEASSSQVLDLGEFKVDRFVCDTIFITRPGFSKSPLVRIK